MSAAPVFPARFIVDVERGEILLEDGTRFGLVSDVSVEREVQADQHLGVVVAIRDRLTLTAYAVPRR